MEANLLATVQTWRGAQSVCAQRIDSEDELRCAFDWVQSNLTMKQMMKLVGFEMCPEQFIAAKDCFTLITFELTSQPTPQPLKADWGRVWAVLLPVCLFLVWIW